MDSSWNPVIQFYTCSTITSCRCRFALFQFALWFNCCINTIEFSCRISLGDSPSRIGLLIQLHSSSSLIFFFFISLSFSHSSFPLSSTNFYRSNKSVTSGIKAHDRHAYENKINRYGRRVTVVEGIERTG
jgi:hypothetical protein